MTADAVSARWPAVLRARKKDYSAGAGALAGSSVEGVEGEKVRLLVPGEKKLALDLFSNERRMKELSAAAARVLGKKVEFQLRLAAAEKRSSPADLLRAAQTDPAIRDLQRRFPSRIIDVREERR